MKWTALGIVAFTTLILLAGCGENFSQSDSGHGTGVINTGGNTNANSSEDDDLEAGITGSPTENPYNCPDGTVIRSDCSIQSQQDCVCMLT